jgi:hypothetical protein
MVYAFVRISKETTSAIAEALRTQKGADLPPHAAKKHVSWAAVRCWPEFYGWSREGTLHAAAERLGVPVTYRR